MILDTTSKKIQLTLSAAPATNQLPWFASWADMTTTAFTPASADGVSNGTTAVDVVAAPSPNTQRQLKHLSVYNADTVNATVQVQLVDGASTRVIQRATLIPGQTLEWLAETGWRSPATLTAATPDFISGLKMSWNSATSISVSSGEAWIPGANALAVVPTTITKSSLSLAASTWHHLYLYSNAGTWDIDVSTTAPAAPYIGTARTKTGDTQRRYIGSVLTDASGNVYGFLHVAASIIYQTNTNAAPFLILSGGVATTATSVSASGVIPVTGVAAKATVLNAASNAAYVRISNSNGPNAATGYIVLASPGGVSTTEIPLDASRSYTYAYDTSPTGSTYHRIFGYTYER